MYIVFAHPLIIKTWSSLWNFQEPGCDILELICCCLLCVYSTVIVVFILQVFKLPWLFLSVVSFSRLHARVNTCQVPAPWTYYKANFEPNPSNIDAPLATSWSVHYICIKDMSGLLVLRWQQWRSFYLLYILFFNCFISKNNIYVWFNLFTRIFCQFSKYISLNSLHFDNMPPNSVLFGLSNTTSVRLGSPATRKT